MSIDEMSKMQVEIQSLRDEILSYRAILKMIEMNTPKSNTQPHEQMEWGFWLAGNFARDILKKYQEDAQT